MATSQDGRSLQLATPLGKDFLLINRFRCHEAISQLFRIELDLLHEEEFSGFTPTKIDSKALIGNTMVLGALQAGDNVRYFHGLCRSFTQMSRNLRFSEYRAELVPNVWLLTQITQSRIFQNKSVPDILTEVLRGFEFSSEIQGAFEPRNYCVQYRETDWDFASRLMEEEGIYYYFEHTAENHKLILANTASSHRTCPGQSSVSYALDRSELEEQWIPAIYSWRVEEIVRTGKHELRDFNFQLPTNKLDGQHNSVFDIGNNSLLENYEWPGGYAKKYDGIDAGGRERASDLNKVFADRDRTIRHRQEGLDAGYKTFTGSGNCASLTAGFRFEFKEHPLREYAGSYVLTEVLHESAQSPGYIGDEIIRHDGYSSIFVCIRHGGGEPTFRPPRITPRPIVYGSQTAFVVGPPGEEIFTDKYGRVKVQFHWDRQDNDNQQSSCWLRVAQTWAGNSWGSIIIPRIGMEVLVDFLEGDPDQPIITGCVFNAANMPPYVLPENKTRSVLFKSNSSKGGGGFNELRVEDKKGSEQIFIHGEKNIDVRIKNDSLEMVQRDRHLIVESEQFELVKKDKHLKVNHNHNEQIDGTMSLKIGVDHQEKVGTNYGLDVGTSVHIKAGTSVVIEAGAMLTLKVGGSFVNINSGGVFVKGAMVMLNSGGAAGSGPGANPELPKPPKEADKADAGKRIQPQRSQPPPQPPNFSIQAATIRVVWLDDTVPSMDRGAAPGEDSDEQIMQNANECVECARARAAQLAEGNDLNSSPPVVPPEGVSSQGQAYLDSAQNAAPFIGN